MWALTLGSQSKPGYAARQKKPNIVLIMADDLGYECLSSYGSTSYRTPNLDGLAATGVRFARAYSTPTCTTTRVQMMTGQYPFRNGWAKNIWNLPKEERVVDPSTPNLAHVLKAAGYSTAVAGKWQLALLEDHPDHAKDFGFDEHCLWAWKLDNEKKTSRYWSPGVWRNGKLVKDLSKPDVLSLRYLKSLISEETEVFGPDYFADYLIDFMTRQGDRPFFAYYPMALTHKPFIETPDNKGVSGLKNGDPRLFVGMVEYMDKIVGRISKALDNLGLRENTLIIFTADNGSPKDVTSRMGDIEIQGGKTQLIEAGTRVPLIVNWKGVAASGNVCEDLVDLSDIFPLLTEVADAAIPSGHKIDGRSFLQQILGKTGNPREWVFSQVNERYAVRGKDWKLLMDGDLFNMKDDPFEKNPITIARDSSESAAAREKLAGVLSSFGLGSGP